jgi:aminoglycoside phosphotransferase family enzyme/predicted kinase
MTEANLPPLIQAMLCPEFYPHPVDEPIELIQTHVSYVLLTGQYAYKIKKAVNFGFLDFSTLEKRQHFCHEEIRLNQRGAGPIYIEVQPISQSHNQFSLNDASAPVEYALKMHQFREEDLFISLFEQGKLTEELMIRLGKFVAEFHQSSPTNDYILSFGEVAQVRQAFDENYQQTEAYIGKVQTDRQFQDTKAYTDDFFTNRAALFKERIQRKLIKECHGDLHLRNIAFLKRQIILFDCIEFNEPFRFVDVMYDIAFAVMDLDARSHSDLGNVFLNTYVEQTGDWEGLQLLPLYLSRQAYVRAKVTSFLLDDPNIDEEGKRQASRVAANYYYLAWQYTQTPPVGKLIMVTGLSGSGKSTVSRYIAKQTKAIHIRSDAVRKHLAGIPVDQRGTAEIYAPEMSKKTYDRLLELGLLLAQQGFTVILDAKYDRLATRQQAIAAAEAANIPLHIYHCTAPAPILRERLTNRNNDIADATADLVTAQLANLEPFTATEAHWVTTIDTTKDWKETLNLF